MLHEQPYSGLPIGSHRFRHDCKPTSTSKPVSVTVTAAGAVWVCHRCGETGNLNDERSRSRPILTTSSTNRQTFSDFARDTWGKCETLSGIATEYLLARRCVIPPQDGDLRWHPNLMHYASQYCGPALVGLVTDAITGRQLSLHRTWIKADGSKADVDPPRMFLKDHTTAGGVIRLWPDEEVTTSLSIGEGIESCLAAAHGATPIWSCLDAGNMQLFPILRGIESLVIFADHDEAGT